MLGKIIGIAGVGLTQLLIWIVLIGTLTTIVTGFLGMQMPQQQAMELANPELAQGLAQNTEMGNILQVLSGINYVQIILSFVFYFLGGYLHNSLCCQ